MGNYLIYALWAFAAGAIVPVMMIFNAHLARSVGGSQVAFPILLLIGFLTAFCYFLVTRSPMPNLETLKTIPPQYFVGGLIVAFYMLSVTFLAPRFGVGNTVMFVVLAQLCVSTAVDTWGLFGAPVRALPLMRIIGLLIIVAGVIITQYSASLSQRP